MYRYLMLAGIAVTLWYWTRLVRRDKRLFWIYLTALAGAFLGAKASYLLAEGWLDWSSPERWQRVATGKSITGALLGGYLAVEIAKKLFLYRGVTGDWFALVAPIGIILGRIGCWFQGCCAGVPWNGWMALPDAAGVPRWPAVPAEIFFNLAALATFAVLRKLPGRRVEPGLADEPPPYLLERQHFHLYLIGYGVFRFGHEFLREAPRVIGPLTGYHLAAVAVGLFGVVCFWRRQRRLTAQGT